MMSAHAVLRSEYSVDMVDFFTDRVRRAPHNNVNKIVQSYRSMAAVRNRTSCLVWKDESS